MMKITIIEAPINPNFSDITVGTVFKYSGGVCIKLNNSSFFNLTAKVIEKPSMDFKVTLSKTAELTVSFL